MHRAEPCYDKPPYNSIIVITSTIQIPNINFNLSQYNDLSVSTLQKVNEEQTNNNDNPLILHWQEGNFSDIGLGYIVFQCRSSVKCTIALLKMLAQYNKHAGCFSANSLK